ncbi:MAG: prepilin-type N-terminal cleavage/methylation domain-containing protein, partial [Patescibacteria group bacterium]
MEEEKGFTLVEVLVVISIIMLLSSIAFTSFKSIRSKARDAQRIVEIKQLQTALELYYEKNGHYPVSRNCGAPAPYAYWCTSLQSLIPESGRWIKNYGSVAMEGYLSHDPLDPLQKEPLVFRSLTANTNVILYYAPTGGQSYMLA